MKCSYQNIQDQPICSLPVDSNSRLNFCLLHDPDLQKTEAELLKLIKFKISQNDYNFEGSIFSSSLHLREIVFSEFVNFENCQFLGGETNFYRAQFKKGVLFNQSIFKGRKLNFSKANFGGDFNFFNGAIFECEETLFVSTSFQGKHIGFASVKFSGNSLSFKEASFKGTVSFNQSEFHSKNQSFEKIKSTGSLFSFADSSFSGDDLRFSEAKFQGNEIDFSKGNFENKNVSFKNIFIQANHIKFSEIVFNVRSISFQGSQFDFENLSFMNSSFHCQEIDFSEVVFRRGKANFLDANFHARVMRFYPLTLENKTTDFNQTEFAGEEKSFFIVNPDQNDLSFQGVYFYGGRAKLKGDLHAASFIDTSLDNVDFNEAQWNMIDARVACRDEVDAIRTNSVPHFRKAAEVCRHIKKCYESFGSYEVAGNFYYGEMECRRKMAQGKNWGLQFMRLTSGYGERPTRVILTSMSFMFFCAFFYLFGGIQTPQGIINRDISFRLLTEFRGTAFDFLNCLYFSVVSFTTLGYGDFHPVGWSRLIGASEGFVGAFFMALFVLTIGRKMNR